MLDQYGTPRAFRQALETRLMAQSRATAVLGDVRLAGKSFASVRMDVVARAEEIADAIEPLIFSSALAFAGLASSVTVPAIDVAQHGAEKFHALTRTYGQRPNTRVKDLVDLVLLAELDLIDPTRLAHRVRTVFRVRDTHLMPAELPEPPSAWRDDYLGLIEELDIGARTIEDAMAVVRPIWRLRRERRVTRRTFRCV